MAKLYVVVVLDKEQAFFEKIAVVVALSAD